MDGGASAGVADVGTGEVKVLRQPAEVHVVAARRRLREVHAPESLSIGDVGQHQLHDVVDPTRERGVEVLPVVGRQEHGAGVALHPLQQSNRRVNRSDQRPISNPLLHYQPFWIAS